jgi:hypothetical protein
VSRRIPLLLAVLSAAFVWVGGSQAAVSQTIYAWFDVDGNLNFRYVDNSPVGSTIPPGTYQIVLNNNTADDYAVDHVFHIFGPGVDYKDPPGAVQTSFSVTFQTGQTYTIQDDLDPKDIHQSFVATNAPPPPTSTGSTGGTGGTGSTGSGGKTPVPTSSDIVGSGVAPFRGALDAIVFKSGKLSLSRNGKTVKSLKSGRYTFSVDDESTKAGFSVQLLHGKRTTVTGAAYTGSHDVTLQLKPGRWFFFTPGGKQTTFFVIS